MSTVAGLVPGPLPAADQLILEDRLLRRQMRRRAFIMLLVAAVAAVLVGVSVPIGNHLRTAWWLERLGCTVDWQIDETNWRQGGVTAVAHTSRRWNAKLGDSDLPYLLDLHRVRSLGLAECDSITDKGLAMLGGLDSLTELNLTRLNRYRYARYGADQAPLTDACLVSIRSLPRLQSLALSGNRITDQGLSCLAELRNLKVLVLDATEVSDAGLVYLQGMKSLQSVNLAATRVTSEGVRRLWELRPDLAINSDTEPDVEQGVKLRRGARR
jgi:hypothetical protein